MYNSDRVSQLRQTRRAYQNDQNKILKLGQVHSWNPVTDKTTLIRTSPSLAYMKLKEVGALQVEKIHLDDIINKVESQVISGTPEAIIAKDIAKLFPKDISAATIIQKFMRCYNNKKLHQQSRKNMTIFGTYFGDAF
ncbi:MAG: Ulp1 family protease [Alphaproteobacteria bacterium]|jgi:Ulp1 family protease